MSKDLDSQGQLILENLSSEERLELIYSICEFVKEAGRIWERDFQTEYLDISDLDQSDPSYGEMMSRVEAAGDEFVWTQINGPYNFMTQAIYPVENLGPIWFSGEFIVLGKRIPGGRVWSNEDEVVGYHLASNPRHNISSTDFFKFMSKHVPASDKDSYASITPYVWIHAQFDCPFCAQDLECTGDKDFTYGLEHSGGAIYYSV